MKEDLISTLDQAEQLFNTKAELYTLKLSGKAAIVLAKLLSQIFFGLVSIIILLLVTLGLSLWLGESLGNSYVGFLIIGGALTILISISLRMDIHRKSAAVKNPLDIVIDLLTVFMFVTIP